MKHLYAKYFYIMENVKGEAVENETWYVQDPYSTEAALEGNAKMLPEDL